MATHPDRLINQYGTVVTLADDPADVDEPAGVYGRDREGELRAAGYRDLERDETVPAQTHAPALAERLKAEAAGDEQAD